MSEQMDPRPRPSLQAGQAVEVIAFHIPAHMGLHRYDGSTGKIMKINERRIAQVIITAEREDALCGRIYVPENALKPVKPSAEEVTE